MLSVLDLKAADERIPDLLATPAAVRAISAEPLLGPVDLRGWGDHAPAAESNAPGKWADFQWPDWVPAKQRESIKGFWTTSPNWGRTARRCASTLPRSSTSGWTSGAMTTRSAPRVSWTREETTVASRIIARSIVRLTVEVQHTGGHWGDDCTIAQAHKQAADSAFNIVERALSGKEGEPRIIRIESVDAVITKETVK